MARQPEKPPRKSYLLARQSGQRIVQSLFKRRMRADDMQQILRCSRICDRLRQLGDHIGCPITHQMGADDRAGIRAGHQL